MKIRVVALVLTLMAFGWVTARQSTASPRELEYRKSVARAFAKQHEETTGWALVEFIEEVRLEGAIVQYWSTTSSSDFQLSRTKGVLFSKASVPLLILTEPTQSSITKKLKKIARELATIDKAIVTLRAK